MNIQSTITVKHSTTEHLQTDCMSAFKPQKFLAREVTWSTGRNFSLIQFNPCWHAGAPSSQDRGRDRLPETCQSSICLFTMPNLVAPRQTVCTLIGGPKKLQRHWVVAPRMMRKWLRTQRSALPCIHVRCVSDPRNTPVPNMCYHSEYGQTVWKLIRGPKNILQPWAPAP